MKNKWVASLIIFSFPLFSLNSHAALSTKEQAPSLKPIKKWVGADLPIFSDKMEGKIVLISFWNPSSIKSLREIKILKRWHERYNASAPFEIVGVAVPEFKFKKKIPAMEAAILPLKLPFPVAIDSDHEAMKAYKVRSIPYHVLVDENGFIRQSYSENIDYRAIEERIRTLLEEMSVKIPFIGKTAIPGMKDISGVFFGYKNLSGYGGTEKLSAENTLTFRYPERTEVSHFYLSGNWIPQEESLKTALRSASIKMLFTGSSAALTAGAEKRTLIPAEVRLDGFPLTKKLKGKDIIIQEGKSYVFIKEYRIYKLFRDKKRSGLHTLEIIFEEPGIEIFQAGFE